MSLFLSGEPEGVAYCENNTESGYYLGDGGWGRGAGGKRTDYYCEKGISPGHVPHGYC